MSPIKIATINANSTTDYVDYVRSVLSNCHGGLVPFDDVAGIDCIYSSNGVKDFPKANADKKNNSYSMKIIPQKYALPDIEQVVFNDTTTVIIWADNKKTVVKCGEGETFDRYTGFMAAVCKRLFGTTMKAKDVMNSKDKAEIARAVKEEKEKKARENKENEKKNHDKRIKKLMKRMNDEREALNRLSGKDSGMV